ncbi:MAG: SAM-dependent methyltransferase [Candidatus Rokubacteria bacterium 13_1_40CM_4_67_11]|nr:MAG: SAM-dependent methyltransferase [Candidatus Rokubacteria bacterium 13_1_40CM_4_67_11]
MAGCLFCSAPLRQTFVDLGMSPLCESYLPAEALNQVERFYPLHAYVCERCFLVQVEQYVSPEAIFTEYAYFSSFSDSWLAHAKAYVDMIVSRLGLSGTSRVIELGSNDGYLLQYFVAKGMPVLGVEPARNVAEAAVARGVPTHVAMFGRQTARELQAQGLQADLLIGNNVLAQVPDVNDFVAGMKLLLKPGGVLTMEFPHLMRLMQENQFDTIYHEHFSYFSFLTAERIFAAHGLRLFDVQELRTHGGSLRIYAGHAEESGTPESEDVTRLRAREASAGLNRLETYAAFTEQVHETKRRLLEFLINVKRAGKHIAGYGAPGKGNTLLNYCGIRTDFLDYTVDRNPYKHGRFLPGTHIPIHAPEKIRQTRPDYVLILPWNLKDEIMEQVSYIREWAGQFVVPIPDVKVYP